MPRFKASPPAAPLRIRRAAATLLDDLEAHLGDPTDRADHPLIYLCAAQAGRDAGPDPLHQLRAMLLTLIDNPGAAA